MPKIYQIKRQRSIKTIGYLFTLPKTDRPRESMVVLSNGWRHHDAIRGSNNYAVIGGTSECSHIDTEGDSRTRELERGTSGRWRASAAAPCSARRNLRPP